MPASGAPDPWPVSRMTATNDEAAQWSSPGRRFLPGRPWPLGASIVGDGVQFAVWAPEAQRLDLCLFDQSGDTELSRLPFPARVDGVWHGVLHGAGAGLVYGLRAHGPHDPSRGQAFNPAKLLLDPYARSIVGEFRWTDAHLGMGIAAPLDNARDMVKAVVVDAVADDFDWRGDRPPATPLADSVLYEVHVRGFSQRHPDIDPAQRGRYAGLASPAAIAHFKRLGVTGLKLLPVHQFIDEMPLARRGLSNYWGYNTLGFFLPHRRYAQSHPRNEFRAMVRDLHAAGIEVILDVVYNHTCEGDGRGPTLSWRGLANAGYYRLLAEDLSLYDNLTGTGNALRVDEPRVMQMILDSLRFWVTEMHVDGFRFDLAATLARGPHGFDARSAFLQCVAQDPVLAGVKLIAEPWDIGPGGYQLGAFPGGWSEWNDRYRDAARSFWVRKSADRGELASRLAGSSDLFRGSGRAPQASVNFITAHDGFTLRDLVSYDHKHNIDNGEDNRDGTDRNLSWNCGVEGDTDLLAVLALRGRLQRALIATLLLSQGVPMLLGGDELDRTQGGNNNAFNQDNATSWFDWAEADDELTGFVARMIALRARYPQLRRRTWLTGGADADGRRDVVWFNRIGQEMTAPQWEEAQRYTFGMLVAGLPTADQAPSRDLLLLLNADARDWAFPLPEGRWRRVLDTGERRSFEVMDVGAGVVADEQGRMPLKARSLVVLEAIRGEA